MKEDGMSDTADAELRDVIARFTTAEQSLRLLLDASNGMNGAQKDLTQARVDLDAARESGARALRGAQMQVEVSLREADLLAAARLDRTVDALNARLAAAQDTVLSVATAASKSLAASQSAVMDAGGGVHALTRQLTDIVRDLNHCALALRSLQPDQVRAEMAAILRGQKRTRRLFWAWGLVTWAMCLGILAAVTAPFWAPMLR
jgi:hypothetical protein